MASGRRFSRSQSALPSISVTQDSTTPSTSKVPGSQLHTGAIVDIWIDTEEKWSRAKLGSKLSRGNDDDEVRYKIEFEDKNRADREFPFVPEEEGSQWKMAPTDSSRSPSKERSQDIRISLRNLIARAFLPQSNHVQLLHEFLRSDDTIKKLDKKGRIASTTVNARDALEEELPTWRKIAQSEVPSEVDEQLATHVLKTLRMVWEGIWCGTGKVCDLWVVSHTHMCMRSCMRACMRCMNACMRHIHMRTSIYLLADARMRAPTHPPTHPPTHTHAHRIE